MTISAYAKAIDDVLRPIGFKKKRHVWNRNHENYIDVVDMQIAKSGDGLAINIGVFEREIYTECWQERGPEFVDEASCIVRTRLGQLIDGKDRWWKLGDPDGLREVKKALGEFGLEFVERMHSARGMELFLDESGVRKSYYPLPAIYLAIIILKSGNRSDGCQLLQELKGRNTGDWQRRVDYILDKHCEH